MCQKESARHTPEFSWLMSGHGLISLGKNISETTIFLKFPSIKLSKQTKFHAGFEIYNLLLIFDKYLSCILDAAKIFLSSDWLLDSSTGLDIGQICRQTKPTEAITKYIFIIYNQKLYFSSRTVYFKHVSHLFMIIKQDMCVCRKLQKEERDGEKMRKQKGNES